MGHATSGLPRSDVVTKPTLPAHQQAQHLDNSDSPLFCHVQPHGASRKFSKAYPERCSSSLYPASVYRHEEPGTTSQPVGVRSISPPAYYRYDAHLAFTICVVLLWGWTSKQCLEQIFVNHHAGLVARRVSKPVACAVLLDPTQKSPTDHQIHAPPIMVEEHNVLAHFFDIRFV